MGIVFILAFRDLITKRIPDHIPTFIIALANASFVALGGLAFGLYQGFQSVALWQFGLLAAAATLLATGYVFMVSTLRVGDLSGTAPFRYSNVLFAIILGMVFFGEFPGCRVLCRHGADHCRGPLCGAPGSQAKQSLTNHVSEPSARHLRTREKTHKELSRARQITQSCHRRPGA